MSRSRTSRTVLLLLLAAGCTSSSTSDNPGGDSGSGGAAGGGNDDGGRSSADASSSAEGGLRCDAKPDAAAGRSREGVLTNLPALRFSKTGGQLDITSANFDLKKFSDFTSLAIWGDVQNRTSVQQCIPVADVFQMQTEDGGMTDGGTVDVGIVIEGPAYELPGSVFTIVCFDPCESGVFSGVLNTAADDLLDATTTVAYSFSTLVTSPKNLRHPHDPAIVSAAAKQVAGGFALSGTMKAGARDINLLVVNVFVRNATGLVYNEVQARPGNLGTISAGAQFDFETDANADFFTGYELFDKFAVGPAP